MCTGVWIAFYLAIIVFHVCKLFCETMTIQQFLTAFVRVCSGHFCSSLICFDWWCWCLVLFQYQVLSVA